MNLVKILLIHNSFSFKEATNFLLLILRSPSLSELTPMIFNTGLIHLGSEASIWGPNISSSSTFWNWKYSCKILVWLHLCKIIQSLHATEVQIFINEFSKITTKVYIITKIIHIFIKYDLIILDKFMKLRLPRKSRLTPTTTEIKILRYE